MDHESTQTRQITLPRPRRVFVAYIPFHRRRDLHPAPTALHISPVSLIFPTLARTDPNSKEFLAILELFLQSRAEHKRLAQLKGSRAVWVADTLDRVRKHWAVTSGETWADFRVAFGCTSGFLPPRVPRARPPPPVVVLRVVWETTYLLHVPTRSGIFEPTAMGLSKLFRSVQGDVWRGMGCCEGSSSAR